MAKVTFGAIVSEARGSVSDVTFSRCRGGAYVRARVTPTYQNTDRQAVVRARLGTIAARWSGNLDDAQRARWRDFANAHPRRNVFGAEKVLSGFAQFQACNNIALESVGGWLDDPPADLDVVGLLTMSVTISAGAGTMDLAHTPTPLPVDHELYFWATEPLAAGVGCYAPLLRWIGISEKESVSPYDISGAYYYKFGSMPEEGQKVGFRVQTVNPEKGALSVARTTLVTAGA
jgi:hypothetical protein